MAGPHHKTVTLAGDWIDHAACAGEAPGTMFPDDAAGVAVAKRICERCPVTAPCLEYALINRLDDGVWGGTSERQRLKIRKQRRGAA